MGAEPGDATARDPLAVIPGEWHRRITLRDGTPVLLRQIREDDRERLAEGLRRLSPASRYLRFHSAVDTLTDAQLDYLTRVDHRDHEALVALDTHRPERPGIGVARYVREPDDPAVAEAAVTVVDEYQGRGVGTLLLGALSARARGHGIRVFRNYVLAHNRAMLELFDHLGAQRQPEPGGVWRVDLALPEREADLPESATGRAFLAAARQGFRLSSLLPPVWGRRPPTPRTSRDPSYREGIEAELGTLREDLEPWLAERARRHTHAGGRPGA